MKVVVQNKLERSFKSALCSHKQDQFKILKESQY